MADVKKEEKKAEKEAEAEGKMEKEVSKEEAATSPDEQAQEGAATEKKAGVEEVTPAEVEAINTDNETAQEATAKTEGKPAVKPKKEESASAKATADKPKAESQLAPRSSKSKEGEPTGKFKDLIKEIESLTTIELAELVKALEERFGVSAPAPVVTAGTPVAGGPATGAEVAKEEKATYTVVLTDSGSQKIAVIKALREINQELGLKEAKDIADAPPKEILKDVPKEKAEEAKKKLETAGAKVELK